MVIKNKRVTTTHFLIIFTLAVMLVPMSFSDIRVMGLVMTPERVLIPFLAILVVINRFSLKSVVDRSIIYWIVFFVVWIAVGFALLFLSEYTNIHAGLKEMLTIVLAFLTSYLLMTALKEKEYIFFSINVVKTILVIAIIFALFEISTGNHLSTSYFVLEPLTTINKGATFAYYGINDFSAFITLLCPVFLLTNKETCQRFFSGICLTLIFYINIINDARFCVLAMMLGFLITLILYKKINSKNIILIVLSIMFIVFITLFINKYIDLNSTLINKIESRTQEEIYGFYNHNGSMYLRFKIYMDSLSASINNFFIGFGPNSFRNYFTVHPSESNLINPHSMFLEILFNYGIAFLAGLIYFIVKIIKFCGKYYRVYNNIEYLIALVMVFLYIIVSFAPSNFINYSYQWYPFVIGICLINLEMNQYKKDIGSNIKNREAKRRRNTNE